MTGPGVEHLLKEITGAYLVRIGEDARTVWRNALQGLSDEAGMSAVRDFIKGESRAPRPADILRLARSVGLGRVKELPLDERLRRLNHRASLEVAERLQRNDEAERRFQCFMLRKALIERTMTQELRAYFERVLPEETREARS